MKARMRRTSASIDVTYSEQSGSDETLHSTNSKSLDVCVSESRIDRMRKLLSSPLLRRKPNCHQKSMSSQISHSESKVFGVSLEVLSHSNANPSEEPFIPFVITRLCHFIEDSGGLLQEGLFRISGNAKMIDKLKHEFDSSGDANLETEGDIASASALLKLFLRELPQPLIPDTSQFLEAIKNYETDEQTCVHNLRALVSRLPDENYYTLKYLSAFLHRIQLQEENRMTSANLGIVFAPNIFRVSVDNYKGLRDQSVANEVVSLFITNFSEIFSVDSADNSYQSMCPLTVEIPDIGLNTSLTVDSNDNRLRNEVPALLFHTTTQDTLSNRKRKESKCVSSSPPLRSNSEEMLIDAKDRDIRRCSSDENVLNSAFITAVNKFENLNFRNSSVRSPHPPEAKRRELESERRLEESQQNTSCDEFYDKENNRREQKPKNVLEKQKSLNEEIDSNSGPFNENFDSSKENINQNEKQNANNVLFKTCPTPQSSDERNCRPLVEITPTENLNNSNNNNNNNRNAMNFDSKEKIPHLDFKNMYQNSESNEPILSEHRYSWPRSAHEAEANAGSPEHSATTPTNSISQFLKKAVSYEAPLSPSAYRSYLSNRTIHLDPTIPPTPPVEQLEIFVPSIRDSKHYSGSNSGTNTSIRSITKKIQTIKKKIKHFEHEFEKENGFRPSLEQKMSAPDVRVLINETNKLKKDLKEFKDDLYMEVTDEKSLTSTSLEAKEFNCNKSLINITEMIKEIERTVEEKRKSANRPEMLEEMSSEEIVEEKLTLQKSLLRFEALYGRPTTKTERDIVRPLYDRYRIVKRMVAKTMPAKHGSKDSVELQPILEHIAMDFTSPSHSKSEGIASVETTCDSVVGAIDENEFINSSQTNDREVSVPKSQSNNLHEMSLSELNKLLTETRLQKRNLRTVLRDFENEFFRIMGRKVEKEDKVNMGSVYTNYKHTKGKLRLLEALVSKHESQIIML